VRDHQGPEEVWLCLWSHTSGGGELG